MHLRPALTVKIKMYDNDKKFIIQGFFFIVFFSKTVLCTLFPRKRVKFLFFDRKKAGWLVDINTTYLLRRAY